MKPISSLKISISGVRGVIGDSLKPGLLCRFSSAYATYLGPGAIVVGRDTRTSGQMAKHAVLAGLLSSGVRVVDIDLAPVPTVQFTVNQLRARGGIAITASHNPAEWNALKFVREDGCFLNSYQAQEVLDIYHQQEYRQVTSDAILPVRRFDKAIENHIEEIVRVIDPLSEPHLRVAIDCCNGAGSVMTPRLLELLNCEVIPLHCQPDGHFPRPPEPVPENLGELSQLVVDEDADLGFAQDADADRLSIVSETGHAIGEEYSLALCTLEVLSRQRGPVVVNLSTSKVVEDIARSFDSPVFRSAIGEVNVTEQMMEVGAVIGGEGNGGVIYPPVNLARDSFVAMTLVIHLLRRRKQKLSEIVAELPRYQMIKRVFPGHPHKIQALIQSLQKSYSDETLDLTDGLRISRGSGWIHIRPSNTEPVLRLVIEATDRPTLEAYEKEMLKVLKNL